MQAITPGEDRAQALRIQRLFMAFSTYAVSTGLVLYCFYNGWFRLPGWGVAVFAALAGLVNLAFYIMIRSGVNLKFRDPSLTIPQMITASLAILAALYFMDEVRGALLYMYLVTFVFGVFRLRVRQFMALTLVTLALYGVIIFLLVKTRPDSVNLEKEIFHWIVLAVVLPWFSLVGGYISSLRKRIETANGELVGALQIIEQLAVQDELTGVSNRRRLMEVLNKEKVRVDRGQPTFCLGVIDLDHFKRVNDKFGHLQGDQVLRSMIQAIRHEIREIDTIARFGGEEFVILLVNTTLEEACGVAERMRHTASEQRYKGLPDDFGVTVSIGLTEYQRQESVDELLTRADNALYLAKQYGRDRVELELPARA
jgi:diguanylate cyclase (GGDEF)-like protein